MLSQIREYGSQLDEGQAPLTVSEVIDRASAVQTIPQDARGIHPLQTRRGRKALAFAAGLVLMVALTVVLAATRTDVPPAVTTIPTPTTTPAIPPTTVPPTTVTTGATVLDSFTSATSFGAFEWTRVEADQAIYPWAEFGGQVAGLDEALNGWVSSDGVTWEEASGLAWRNESAKYHEAGGETWAVVSSIGGPSTMMGPTSFRQVLEREWSGPSVTEVALFRRQGTEWVQTALPSVPRPEVEGLRAHGPWAGGAAIIDESNWVLPVHFFVEVPWEDIYGQPDLSPIWNESSQVLELFASLEGGGSGTQLATLTVELGDSDTPTIEFRDATTGDLIHVVPATLPGWSPEALLAALRGWGLDDVSFIVNNGGETTVARPPWDMGEEWTDAASIVLDGTTYYTISQPLGDRHSAAGIHLWESNDGLEWTGSDLSQLSDGSFDNAMLSAGNGQLALAINGGNGPGSIWTFGGGDWVQGELASEGGWPSPMFGAPRYTEFGWLVFGYGWVAVSADGLGWETLDLPPLSPDLNFGFFKDMLIFGPDDIDGHFVTWVAKWVD